jgi:hypothetical protein
MFLDVIVFSVPVISLTQKATKLCVTKLQAKRESTDLYIPTNVPVIFFVLDLFQKWFHIFIRHFRVSGMG